jgi:hypothetical protein
MEKQPLANARGVSCWSDAVPSIHHSPSSLTLVHCHGSPQSLEVPLCLSLVVPPRSLVVVPFVIGGPHCLFVALFVWCGGPPFIRHGLAVTW